MGIINVETPDGIKKVEIAGDTPTAEEQAIIANTFSPKTKKIDLSTATKEEIRDYARSQRLKGVDPKTGKQITEEEFVRTYKEPGVDYRTGLDGVDGFSRFTFGGMYPFSIDNNTLNKPVIPAAVSKCPILDLTEPNKGAVLCSLKKSEIELSSVTSPRGVPVAWHSR